MEFVNAVELSRFLRVHVNTVRCWARLGKLPGVKIGRQWLFNLKSVESFLCDKEKCRG